MFATIEQQLKHNDCGISAIKIIYNLHRIQVSRGHIEENLFLDENGSSLQQIRDYFEKEQFQTSFNLLDLNSLRTDLRQLASYTPCILPVRNKQGYHFVV